MPQNVYVLPLETINKMKHSYTDFLTATPPGAVFRAKTNHAVITAYKSGKVLFQGSSPETEAVKWTAEGSGTPDVQKKPKPAAKPFSKFAPPKRLFNENHIGSDEAGTGDYFGPITVASVYVEQQQIDTLKRLGVRDSKALTDPVIRQLSKEIIKQNIPYSLLVLHNEKYNNLQLNGWTQGKMKAMLHHHAISNLLKKIGSKPWDGIIIDQFCEPGVYNRHIASEKESLTEKTFFLTKAESYSIAVAAGSIIARTSFLNEMDKLSVQTGITLPKGASKKVDKTIAEVMNVKGDAFLNKIAKTHFANTKKARVYL